MAVSDSMASTSAAGLASLARRAMAARVAVGIYLALQAINVLLLGIGLYSEFTLAFFDFTFWAIPIVRILVLVLFLACAVLVPVWIWRAHANLHALGLGGLNYSPAWASLSFFVPVAHLVVPYFAMRELYNRSHGEPAEFARSSVDDANAWWTAWIVGTLLMNYLYFAAALGPVTGIHVVTTPAMQAGMILFAGALEWTAAFYLFRLIGAITRAQQSGTGVGETFA